MSRLIPVQKAAILTIAAIVIGLMVLGGALTTTQSFVSPAPSASKVITLFPTLISSTLNPIQLASLKGWAILYNDANSNLLYAKTIDTSTSAIQVFTDSFYQNFTGWTWSDKSQMFAMSGPDGIYTYKPTDPMPKLLVSSDAIGYSGLISPSWLPDGRGVLFVAEYELPNVNDRLNAIMMTESGQMPKTLLGPVKFDNTVIKRTPQVSSDGSFIVFMTKPGGGGSTGPDALAFLPLTCNNIPSAACVEIIDLTTGLTDHSYTAPTNSIDAQYPEHFDYPVLSPDGHHLAFQCSTGLCVIDHGISGFEKFRRLSTSCAGSPAWSPDDNYLVCPTLNALELINVEADTGEIITNLVNQHPAYEQIVTWIPSAEMNALQSVPPPLPSPTASQNLELQTSCKVVNDAWEWIIVNHNSLTLAYSLDIYDPDTKTIEETHIGKVSSAKGGVPETNNVTTQRYDPSSIAQLYVNNVLQATSTPNETRCPTITPKPTQ